MLCSPPPPTTWRRGPLTLDGREERPNAIYRLSRSCAKSHWQRAGKGRPSPFGPVGVGGNSKTTYTPWLVVRYAVGDIGDRPLPAATVFRESPDVWVVSSRGINQPVVGEANQVFGRVTNYGLLQANGVVVKFWWADPSLAITEASAHLIGVAFTNIPSLRSQVVQCPHPWVPIEEIRPGARESFAPRTRLFARRLLEAALPGEGGDGFCQAPQLTHTVNPEAWESMAVELRGTVPAGAKPGDTFVLRVLQRVANLVIGGYTVAVLVD